MVELLVVFSVLAGVGVIGLIVALALMPVVLHAGLLAFASSVLAGGVGEFFGRRRAVRIGCLLLAVALPLLCVLCLLFALLVLT